MLERFLPRQEFSSYEDFKQNYSLTIPEDFNFGYDIVDQWAREEPEKRALVWCNDHGEERVFTFTDISRLSSQAAHFFASQGIKKGSRVLLILRRRYEYWICATALCKLGAVVIPATLQLTTKDIVYRVNAANVSMIVCVDDDFVVSQVNAALPGCDHTPLRTIVAGRREGYLNFDDGLAGQPESFPRPEGDQRTHNDDLMLMYFTSGTTGMPKMVMHDFTHPLGHIVTAKYWQQVQENKLHMSVSDSGWAKFGWGKIYGQWICGATIFCYDMDKFIPKRLLEKLEHYKVTTFCAPPTMFRFMLQEDITKYDLSSIKTACIAGEPLNPQVFHEFYKLTGIRLTEGFGQSESTVLIANFPWFTPKPGSTGKPSPLYDIQLINSDGEPCEDGEEGRIVVRGIQEKHPTGLFKGYYGEEGNRSMAGEWYDTGDVAWRDDDGYFWFVGRSDDVIKCSGYRIGPFEVESALIEHPAVVECAVTAAPDPVRGQVVKATIVLTEAYKSRRDDPALVKELQDHVKHVTAPYKYPRVVEFVDELPKTVSGKIKRALLRKQEQEKA